MVAKKLYRSSLFSKSSKYAELISDRWFILSAKYGLIHPDNIIQPYDSSLITMSTKERKRWSERVSANLNRVVSSQDHVTFLAGLKYREYLIQPLKDLGCVISIPMEGLGIGQQLQWLNRQLENQDG